MAQKLLRNPTNTLCLQVPGTGGPSRSQELVTRVNDTVYTYGKWRSVRIWHYHREEFWLFPLEVRVDGWMCRCGRSWFSPDFRVSPSFN